MFLQIALDNGALAVSCGRLSGLCDNFAPHVSVAVVKLRTRRRVPLTGKYAKPPAGSKMYEVWRVHLHACDVEWRTSVGRT